MKNSELGRMWKDVVWSNFEVLFRHLPQISCQYSQDLGQDSNLSPAEYKSEMLLLEQTFLVTPYSLVGGYQCFRGSCRLHLKGGSVWWGCDHSSQGRGGDGAPEDWGSLCLWILHNATTQKITIWVLSSLKHRRYMDLDLTCSCFLASVGIILHESVALAHSTVHWQCRARLKMGAFSCPPTSNTWQTVERSSRILILRSFTNIWPHAPTWVKIGQQ